MNNLLAALVCTILFGLFGHYKIESEQAQHENHELRDSLTTNIELVRDSCYIQKQINLRYRQFISGSQERKLKEDSAYLYLINKEQGL